MDDLYISDEVYSQLAKALDPTAATRCELTLTLLCDSGNVVFDLADRKQYLVSSTVLGLASNAIGKLLSAIYLEGQLLSKEAPPTVPFPNDDAAAMRHMLRFLHHKSTERIEQSTTAILNLVLVAEKYGCLSALRAHIMVILKDARDIVWRQSIPTLYNRASAHLNELLDLIAIAYVVRDARVFTRSCRQLIDAAQDSTLAHAHSARGSHLIAPELYQILAEQRAKRRSSLMRLLRKHYKPLQNLVATSRPDALNLVYKRLAHAVHPSRAHTWRSP